MGIMSALVLSQMTKPGGAFDPSKLMQSFNKPNAQQQQGQHGQQQQQQQQYGSAPPYGQQQQQYGHPPQQYGQPTQQYGQPTQQHAYGSAAPSYPSQQPPYSQPNHQPAYASPPSQPSYQPSPAQYGGGTYGQPPAFPSPSGPPPIPNRPGDSYGSSPSFPTPQHGYDGQQNYHAPTSTYAQSFPQPGYGSSPAPYGAHHQYDPQRGVGTAVGVAAVGAAAYGYAHGGKKRFGATHAGAGPQAASSPQYILQILQAAVQDQNLAAFYSPGSLEPLAHRIAQSGAISRIAAEWRINVEVALDLVRLALFDVVLLLDDSGSMKFEENGGRIDDLKLVVSRAVAAATLFDTDGINIRFLNSPTGADHVNSQHAATECIDRVQFNGLTPLGRSLSSKVIEPFVLGPARSGQLRKPVLVIAITDGEPAGEPRDELARVIRSAKDELSRTRYGPDALSIELACVGNDMGAQRFLQEIDEHHEIGRYVDVTSEYELEAQNMLQANPPVQLTPEMYLMKLLLGACDSAFDTKDERRRY